MIIPINESFITESHTHGEIGEIAAGKIHGREAEDEITFLNLWASRCRMSQ
ncbi:MAG: hypothetical protein FVQ85_21925 [Planctomycetes bacterium]|nr:hypothetical protein [Planctomycetota bacterium]